MSPRDVIPQMGCGYRMWGSGEGGDGQRVGKVGKRRLYWVEKTMTIVCDFEEKKTHRGFSCLTKTTLYQQKVRELHL